MNESTPEVVYEATSELGGFTRHGMLVSVYQQTASVGLFRLLEQQLEVSMRTNTYSWLDKFTTLWASIVVGCDHTKDINTELGAHEADLAAVFGFARFPDQSGVNRLLHRFTADNVEQMRRVAQTLLGANTRARDRGRWLRLPGGRRVVVIDLDQRSIVVRGTRFESAKAGFFGRKRGRHGYQLTLAYVGGEIREVLDEYFDPGDTPALSRVEAVLEAVERMCAECGIAPSNVLVRADAIYGTPAVVAKIVAHGFHYLVKGISPQRAAVLQRAVGVGAIFERATTSEASEARWVTDLGWREHQGEGEQQPQPRVRARTIVGAWVHEVTPRRRSTPRASLRARLKREGRARERVVTPEYWLTSLEWDDLPAAGVIEVYNDRQTIEAYFKDEQQALGARHVRTRAWAGAAVFQWLVAITNNVLQWTKQELFGRTPIETLGLKRFVKEVMQIPARIRRRGQQVLVILPRRHELVRRLLTSASPRWSRLAASPPIPRTVSFST